MRDDVTTTNEPVTGLDPIECDRCRRTVLQAEPVTVGPFTFAVCVTCADDVLTWMENRA